MKLLALGIALTLCVPVLAQDRTMVPPSRSIVPFRTATGVRLNGSILGEPFVATATSMKSYSPEHFRLTGNVEVTMKGMNLQADEVDIHWDTGSFEPRGNVHLKPVTVE